MKDAKSEYHETFDYVIVAIGHFSIPVMPQFELNEFAGIILHSHDFKNAEGYKGQSVVVVGASYSAEDVASQLYKFGAKKVYLAHRKADAEGKWMPTGYKWPEGMEEKPNLQGAIGSTVSFMDGSQAEADAIVLCTGYKHSFPFLHKDLMLHCENKLWIK